MKELSILLNGTNALDKLARACSSIKRQQSLNFKVFVIYYNKDQKQINSIKKEFKSFEFFETSQAKQTDTVNYLIHEKINSEKLLIMNPDAILASNFSDEIGSVLDGNDSIIFNISFRDESQTESFQFSPLYSSNIDLTQVFKNKPLLSNNILSLKIIKKRGIKFAGLTPFDQYYFLGVYYTFCKTFSFNQNVLIYKNNSSKYSELCYIYFYNHYKEIKLMKTYFRSKEMQDICDHITNHLIVPTINYTYKDTSFKSRTLNRILAKKLLVL